MKKLVILIVLAVLCQGMFLYAQTPFPNESEFIFFNFSIERVFQHHLGYVIVYRTGANAIARTYLPRAWFGTVGGKGSIAYLRPGNEWPSMSVFFRNGEFSHVLLRVKRNPAHQTWGIVPMGVNLDANFIGITEPVIRF